MTPQRLLTTGIIPALAELEALGIPDTVDARRFILAIALQETSLRHRRQVVSGGVENGPAASYVQFEKGGGCKGVLTHRSAAPKMLAICNAFDVQPTPEGLWEAMRYNDVVAMSAARLLIFTLPSSLPTNEVAGWAQYLSAWRPGRPHPETWGINWRTATIAVGLKP